MAVDRDKVLQAAQKLVEKKRYDKAIVEYQRLVADDPKDARTLLKIGDLYLKLEQYGEAIETYERVGQFYSLQGFALMAIAVYKQIREIIHKHAPHLEDKFGHIVPRLAELYTQLGLTSDALAAYDEVATRLQRAGRDRDAIDIFRKVVELDPSNPLPYLRLAEAFVRVKDLDAAIERFGSAGEILLRLGRRDDALRVVERLLQHRPVGKFARMAAEIYLERGQPNDGMAALTKLQISFKENPKDLETLALLARIFEKLGQPAKAIAVQKEAARIAKDAGKLDAFNALVDVLMARAPQDEGVRLLAAMRHRASSIPAAMEPPAPAREPRMSVDVEVDDAVDASDLVEDYDSAVESEQPFALRPSHHALPAYQPEPQDPLSRMRAALTRAETLRRARSYGEAVQILEAAQRETPASRDLHEKICDVLIEAGQQDAAIRQMLSFANHLSRTNDVEGAARILDEVLLLEPDQAEAAKMLKALGYAVPGDEDAQPAQPDYQINASYGEAPLPSYDLEEVGADAVLSRSAPPQAQRASAPQLDEPFREAPLPSFAIDEEATQFMQVPAQFMQRASVAPAAPAAPAQLDEDALEEVEFFLTHGMLDEARGILHEQLGRLPNHPLLLERLAEVEAQAAADAAPAPAAPQAVMMHAASSAESGVIDLDRSFDIAASLEALDALDVIEGPGTSTSDDPRQVSVESVFEQFKAGVAAQISESDAETHYDLGVAYKEMGLVNDAISEFELASRDPTRECVCQSMVGMMHLQNGDVAAAIDAFLRGLTASQKTTDQELALTYEIGNAYEMRNNAEQALYYFQRVARTDPGYRDPRGSVEDRMTRLQPAQKAPARAVGAELAGGDEFDAAFDDLLSGGKLP